MVEHTSDPVVNVSYAEPESGVEAGAGVHRLQRLIGARGRGAAAALGLSLFVAIIAYHGVGQVAAAVAVAGWGVILVSAAHAGPLLANAVGWRRLLTNSHRLPLATVVWTRWIAESVNGLLPVMQIGGNVVRAQLISQHGVPAAAAGASVVVDITLNVFTQILFTSAGLCLLVLHLGGGQVALPVLIGMVIMGALLGGFYASQRRGLFGGAVTLLAGVTRSMQRGNLAMHAAALDAAVTRLYGERRALVATSGWHMLSWILGAAEVWLALYLLGHPVTVLSALLLESLGQAIRTAAFVIPGALGIQEGGYLVLGGFLGIPPQIALALALLKRVRELLLGLPGLVVWQMRIAAAVPQQPEVEKGGRVT
jgi:putative membrane protein